MKKHILVVEDELIASQHLGRLLQQAMPDRQLDITMLQTVQETVDHLVHTTPDIVFLDIHLADGLSFRVFDSVQPRCPVVFTTAYDQYALDAFRAGGIDYLLKPIDLPSLKATLERIERTWKVSDDPAAAPALPTAPHFARTYRSHFLLQVREKLIPIDVSRIACLYLQDKTTHIILDDGTTHIVDLPLDHFMKQLNPDHFYRANRQYILAHHAIREVSIYPISRLGITLCVKTPERIYINRPKVAEFKVWYTRL